MKAMIFAAGLGTRLKPLTNDLPKALIEVNGKTLLEYVITRLELFGFTDIVINIHHLTDKIIDFLKHNENFGLNIRISDERNKLLETGGGLKKAIPLLAGNEPILLHNVDVLSTIDLSAMMMAHRSSGSLATLAVSQRDTSRYLLFNSENRMAGWKNTKTGEIRGPVRDSENYETLAFSGIHVIDPAIFKLMPDKDVFSIIDLYLQICGKYSIQAFRHNPSQFLDIGKPEQLAKTKNFLEQ